MVGENHKLGIALLLLVLVLAGMLLYRSPFDASNLEWTPDSVEYVAGALTLMERGTHEITINGASYPSRYSPAFSLILSPAYLFFGREPGNGIILVYVLGLVGVVAAFLLGKGVSGYAGGWLAALCLLGLPQFRISGKVVMSDVPATTLVLLLAVLFVRARAAGGVLSGWRLAAVALLVAVSTALRPLTAFVVAPFLWPMRTVAGPGRWLRVSALLAPLAAVAAAQLVGNVYVFGSPFRGGYAFWCPVPYDYPWLTFSLAYVGANLVALLGSGVVSLAMVAVLVVWLHRRQHGAGVPEDAIGVGRSVGVFAAVGLTPLLAVHAAYFYAEPRFFLPLSALLAAVTGGLGGKLLHPAFRGRFQQAAVAAQCVFIGLAALLLSLQPDPPPERRLAAESIRRHTPENAIIVASVDPVYLWLFIRETPDRFVVPLSRSVEYASKLVSRERVKDPQPPPAGPTDHRCEGLRNGGAEEVIGVTADENMKWLAAVMKQRPVFLETTGTLMRDLPVLARLQETFTLTGVDANLYRLGARE